LERREEIEQEVHARVWSIGDPNEVRDPAYAAGLTVALDAALGYFLEGMEAFEQSKPPIPPAVSAQARLAAQAEVDLELPVRRCLAGHAVFCDFLVEEARQQVEARELARLLRTQAMLLDALVAEVSREYRHVAMLVSERRLDTPEKRKLDLVRRLLDGERLDASALGYELEGAHIGVLASGRGAADALQVLASFLRSRLLLVLPEREVAWAWLRTTEMSGPEEIGRVLASRPIKDVAIALGESAEGPTGWRLTHRQASAALPIAVGSSKPVVRYADVMFLVSILHDDLLRASLRHLYLEPLEKERDGGEAARATLRAYFASGQNASAAAAALSVSRRTISNRLHAIEERLGRSIKDGDLEIGAALRLEEAQSIWLQGGKPNSN
jgi:hypothetical protein